MPSSIFPTGGSFHVDGVHSDTWRVYYRDWAHSLIPNVRLNLIDIPGRTGKRDAGSEISSAMVRLSLTCLQDLTAANPRQDMWDKLHAMAVALDPRTGPHKLIVDDDYPGWYINVQPTAETPVNPNIIMAQFDLSLEAADPHWYSTTSQDQVRSGVASGGTFTLPNAGNTYAPVQWILTTSPGVTANNPVVLTVGTGGSAVSVTYGGKINPGDVITIDSGTLTVTKNGINDIANWSGDFPQLPAGTQTVTVTTGNAVAINVEAKYTERNL